MVMMMHRLPTTTTTVGTSAMSTSHLQVEVELLSEEMVMMRMVMTKGIAMNCSCSVM